MPIVLRVSSAHRDSTVNVVYSIPQVYTLTDVDGRFADLMTKKGFQCQDVKCWQSFESRVLTLPANHHRCCATYLRRAKRYLARVTPY